MEQDQNLNLTNNKFFSKNNLVIFLAGCLGGTIFAPIFFFPALLSISYLCYKIKESVSFKESFFLGLIFGFGYYLISIYWISIAINVYIEEFWWAIPLALFGLPFLLSFFTAITCAVSSLTKSSNYFPFFFSIIWVFYEWVSSWILTGFPWSLIGYSLSFSTALIQPANLFGIYGLSFIVMNIVTNLYHIFSKDYKKFAVSIIYFIFIIVTMLIYGVLRLKYNPTNFSNFKVRLVQPSIAQSAKWNLDNLNNNLTLLESLSIPIVKSVDTIEPLVTPMGTIRSNNDDRQNVKSFDYNSVDLIIWPESALILPLEHQLIKPRIIEMLKVSDSILLTGSEVDNLDTAGNLKLYTSMQAINANGIILFEYHKSHLVPFGEYMPFKNLLPFKKLTEGFMDYSEGESKLVYLEKCTVFEKFVLLIKPLICYESIFPALVRTPNNLADVIINVTNDAWYGKSSGPYQHLYINIMRSVENGLPMLRDANNGISTVIDPVGRVVKKLKLNKVGFIDSFVPLKLNVPTLYSKIGELSLIILFFFCFLMQYLINFCTKRLIK